MEHTLMRMGVPVDEKTLDLITEEIGPHAAKLARQRMTREEAREAESVLV